MDDEEMLFEIAKGIDEGRIKTYSLEEVDAILGLDPESA